MNYKEQIKSQYPHTILPRNVGIIHMSGSKTNYRWNPDYLSFRLFHSRGIFTTKWNRVSIETKLQEKYRGYRYEFFLNNNLLPEISKVPISDLNFYQDEINLDRLDNIGSNILYIEEPVLIIRDGEQLILYNGYHRTTIHIFNEKSNIMGYIFDL